MKISIFFILVLLVFGQCDTPSVNIASGPDPDIVIVNMEEGDRAFIGNLLQKIDSFKPAVIAIDAMFEKEKDPARDSILVNALKSIENDIILYWLDQDGLPIYPAKKFSSHAKDIGLGKFERNSKMVNSFVPMIKANDKIHETFPMTIVRTWKPAFKHNIKTNQSIKINYTRGLGQFLHIQGSDLGDNVAYEALNNKVVLVGYTGPGNEDKYFTPLRFVKDYPDGEPDTYGIVIIANAIRTILEHGKPE